MLNHWTDPPDTPPSPWTVALCRLLAGLSETAIGMGLLLGQTATVIERRALGLPRRTSHDSVTYVRGPVALDKATA